MSTVLTNSTPPIVQTASAPATWATRVNTMHGMVTVRSSYDATGTQWRHRIPSFSQAGSFRTVTAGACDCPARRQCWHERAAAAAEASIHETLWSVLKYEFALDGSMDAYGRGLATCETMHITTTGGYRAARSAAYSAMEVLG